MHNALGRDVQIPPFPPLPPQPSRDAYTQYERLKTQLTQRYLTPEEYSQAVRKIADWLGV